MLEIGIESSVLKDIQLGRKTVEGRLGKKKFLKIREGDVLSLREDLWSDGNIVKSITSDVKIRITQILYFESFREMLESIDHKTVIPSTESSDEAVAVYRKFYTPEDEDKFGVIALSFTTL